jgi:hypothetical protein
MKKLALFSLLLINTCYADQLTSYQHAVDALSNGKHLTYFVDWDLCKLNVPIKPNFLSSFSPDGINIDKSGFIQSKGVRYSHEIKLLPQLGPTNQAYVYTFTKDNELHVINRFLDPITFAEKMKPLEATCKLGEGFKVFA